MGGCYDVEGMMKVGVDCFWFVWMSFFVVFCMWIFCVVGGEFVWDEFVYGGFSVFYVGVLMMIIVWVFVKVCVVDGYVDLLCFFCVELYMFFYLLEGIVLFLYVVIDDVMGVVFIIDVIDGYYLGNLWMFEDLMVVVQMLCVVLGMWVLVGLLCVEDDMVFGFICWREIVVDF